MNAYKMTPRQSFAIFCKTGFDVRACNPSLEDINRVFAATPTMARETVEQWAGAVLKRREAKPKVDCGAIFAEANEAGRKAVQSAAATIKPMTVIGEGGPWHVPDGVCGFAGVVIRPARGAFVTWLRDNRMGFSNYGGGYYVPIHDYNQSMQKKEIHAYAMAEVLTRHGIKASVNSRMD